MIGADRDHLLNCTREEAKAQRGHGSCPGLPSELAEWGHLCPSPVSQNTLCSLLVTQMRPLQQVQKRKRTLNFSGNKLDTEVAPHRAPVPLLLPPSSPHSLLPMGSLFQGPPSLPCPLVPGPWLRSAPHPQGFHLEPPHVLLPPRNM